MPNIQVITGATRQAEKLRVAAYCRVSSDSSDQLNSLTTQRSHYQRLIATQSNRELVDIYADEAVTGTRADTRREFQRLMRDCRRGRIDKILVKSISRFARNTRDCLTFIRELKSLGVEVFFEKERINTASMGGEMMLSIYGMMAQEESIAISSNQKWALRRRMQAGQFITTRAPYGFEMEGGELCINQKEAPIVRRIFGEYLNGVGMTAIALRLAEEDITKAGGHWTRKSVEWILKNEKYAGNALLQKRYTTDSLPFRRVWNYGERDMYYVENSNPPIIPQETFELAQNLMKKRSTYDGSPKSRYPFSHVIRCGHCGSTFKRKFSKGKIYWGCSAHLSDSGQCPMCRLPEFILQSAFLRLWNKLRANRQDILVPLIAQLEAYQTQSTLCDSRVSGMDVQIAELHAHNQALAQLRAKGYLDVAMYTEQTNRNNARIQALQQQRRHLLAEDEEETLEKSRHLLGLLEKGQDGTAEFDVSLFQEAVAQITVHSPTALEFALRNGLVLTETIPDTRRYRT